VKFVSSSRPMLKILLHATNYLTYNLLSEKADLTDSAQQPTDLQINSKNREMWLLTASTLFEQDHFFRLRKTF